MLRDSGLHARENLGIQNTNMGPCGLQTSVLLGQWSISISMGRLKARETLPYWMYLIYSGMKYTDDQFD